MSRMFRLNVFSYICIFMMCSQVFARQSIECGPEVVSNNPECGGQFVFDGLDADMPVNSTYRIALKLTHDDAGRVIEPESVLHLFNLMQKSLPNWYLLALKDSRGDDECLVTINNVSYSMAVVDWLWRTLRRNSRSAQLVKELSKLGLDGEEEYKSAILDGFCAYVKDGEVAALKSIGAE